MLRTPLPSFSDAPLSFARYDNLSARAKRKFASTLAILIEKKFIEHPEDPEDPKLRRTISKSKRPHRSPHYIYTGLFGGYKAIELAESMVCISKTEDKMTFEVFGKLISRGGNGVVRKSLYTVTYEKNGKPKVTLVPSSNAIKIAKTTSQSNELAEEARIGNIYRGKNTHQFQQRTINIRHFSNTKSYMSMLYHSGKNLGVVSLARLSEAEAIVLMYEILNELRVLQNKKIIHRDIKLENIIYDESSGRIRLIDFGASELATQPRLNHNCYGTLAYAAPEANIIASLQYKHTMCSDLWSTLLICLQTLLRTNEDIYAETKSIKELELSSFPQEKIIKCVDTFYDFLNREQLEFRGNLRKILAPIEKKYYLDLISEIDAILSTLENIKQQKYSTDSLKFLMPYLSRNYEYHVMILSFFNFFRRDILLKKFLDELNNKNFALPPDYKKTFIDIFTYALNEDPAKRQPDGADATTPNTEAILERLQPIYEHCLLKVKYEHLQKGITEIDKIVDEHLHPEPNKERYRHADKSPKQKKKKEFYESARSELAKTCQTLDIALKNGVFSQEEYKDCYDKFISQTDKLQNDDLIKTHSSRFWKIMDYVARPLARIFGYTKSLSEQAISTAGAKEVAQRTAKLQPSLKCSTFGSGLSNSRCRAEKLKENTTLVNNLTPVPTSKPS